MKVVLLCFIQIVFLNLAAAQILNTSNRLPLSPDMPEWAKLLYKDDAQLNLYTMDKTLAPWKATYDSLKIEMAKAGDAAPDALKTQFSYYKTWIKYYNRWRGVVYPYVQEDGSLLLVDTPVMAPKKSETPANADNFSDTWTQIGPFKTRWAKNDNAAQPLCPWQTNIYAIDVAPSNADIVYYGSETGIMGKTTDKGLNWSMVGANYFRDNILSIAIHPNVPDTVYAAESKRVCRTVDAGLTWTTVSAHVNTNDLKIKPDDPQVVLAAGDTLFRRTSGNVWTAILTNKTYDLAFKPDDASIVYALVRNPTLDLCEFWKSTDGGQTFSIRSAGWISGLTDGGGRLSVTPADNNRVYAVLITGSGPRVMRSTDAGENWEIIGSGNTTPLAGSNIVGMLGMSSGQGYYDLSIVASHDNADHLIVGTTTAYKTTNAGAAAASVSWAPTGGYFGSFSIHPDIQEMIAKGSDTWIVTDGGINLSNDFYTNNTIDVNYFVRVNGMVGTEYWGFDSGWNEDVLVGGRYHNGNSAWREGYPSGDYLRMGGGEAPTGYVNPGNAAMVYYSDLGGRILPTANNQNFQTFTVTKWPNEDFYSMHGGEMAWDPRYMYTYYLGKGHQLWKTTDNGATFTAIYTHANTNAEISYIEVSRTDPDVIYFTVQITNPSNTGELWKTTNGGTSWTQCANPGTLSGSQRIRSNITLSGTDANTIWWGFRTGPNGQKVFKSADGGTSWTNWTTTTLNNFSLSDIVHQLGTNGGVYVVSGDGASQKVYYRDNVAGDWTVHNSNLPYNLNGDFAAPFCKLYYKGKKIRLATGNGIWEADFYTNSTTTLVQPMVDNATPNCERDTIQLESYSVVNGNATYQWSVSPTPQYLSNANIRNPKLVLGSTPGDFSLTLTVTDDNGTTSRTLTDFLHNLSAGNLCQADTIPGKSLSLDGSGDYARASGNLNLNSNTVTLTAWIKRNGTQVDFTGLVFCRGGSTTAGLSITSGNQLRYTWNDSAGSYNFNTNLTVPDNTWTHIALVITATNAKVYMNGVAATRTAAHAIEEFDSPLQIGYDNGSRYFKGQIEEVTVWNKSLSQDEIRELMHLTINPANYPELKSYYQFNESSGKVYDKVGTRHATLLADATRATATCPVGKGLSARQTVSAAGTYEFGQTGLKMEFPASGTYPNGELCVSRINQNPDALPTGVEFSRAYWIVNNFGANASFTALNYMECQDVANIPPSVLPADLLLYKRGSTQEGNTWSQQDQCDLLTPGVHATTQFSSGNNITSFSQFIVASNVSLPVEWLQFTATLSPDKNINLDWQVFQSGNVDYFVLEKSADGLIFNTLATVQAQPLSGTFRYNVLDTDPLPGNNFYRIRSVDHNGDIAFSPIRLVNLRNDKEKAVLVFPNPAQRQTLVQVVAGTETKGTLSLFNPQGALILFNDFDTQTTIQTDNLPAGMYYYEVSTGAEIFSGKLIITN